MKICILFSGHLRSYSKVRINIYDNLINPLLQNGYDVDLYASIWKTSGYRENDNFTDDVSTENMVTIINDCKSIELENDKREFFIDKYGNNERWKEYKNYSGPNTLPDASSMWYKIYKSFRLIDNNIYDVVFRIRPDLYFLDKFDVNLLKNLEFNTIYMADKNSEYKCVTYDIMDHFSYGDYYSMKEYCNTYNNIDNIIKRNDIKLTSEGLLYSNLNHYGIRIHKVDIKYGLQRQDKFEIMT